ncbi:MAG: hypothetical protein LBB60_07735 [Desulfovibrio sp.]|jgi:hypothetical protein|nr:hypothetical protein [Desulfovibrio sp.]
MFDGIKNNISSRLSPTKEHWSGLRSDLNVRLRGFRSNRAASLQDELDDFALLLNAWGIESEAAIPGIICDLRLRCLILAIPVVLAALTAVFTQTFAVCLTLAFTTPPCLFGLLTTLWRMSVLEHRAFMPFRRWLLGGFTRKHS